MWQLSCCGSVVQENDWSSDSNEEIIKNTLLRDYLLMKLQELEDSQTSKDAEEAIQAIDEAVSEDDSKLLRFLFQAGAQSSIYETLSRENGKPSPLVAASLLCKFARHNIGFRQTIYGPVVDTTPRSPRSVMMEQWGYSRMIQ
jgi:hypothetical protein